MKWGEHGTDNVASMRAKLLSYKIRLLKYDASWALKSGLTLQKSGWKWDTNGLSGRATFLKQTDKVVKAHLKIVKVR